ncbi:MAG: hypothetical protein P8098_06710 [Candidatus Thiodiazotropha sp.]
MAVQKGLPGMTDTESGGMSMHGHQGMNADCQHCVEYDQTGCDGHGCSQTHCTACFPGLLSTTKLTLTTTSADSYPVFDQVFSNRYSSHPFRPPKT